MNATLERYMTRHPHSIRVDEKVVTAAKLMRTHNIRHLPVLEGGELRGVLSDRDVKMAGGEHSSKLVSDVYIEEPFAVDVDTSMHLVVTTMAEKKLGSTIILEEGKVVGIFTAVDACRVLAEFLHDKS
jgi:acetoin utilization protein AcuB